MFAMKKGSNAWCGWLLIHFGVAIPAKCPASDLIPDLTKHYHEVSVQFIGRAYIPFSLPDLPHLGYCSVTHLSRHDVVILRRLRIGHTRVTHKYLLSGDSQPLCDKFKCSLTKAYPTGML